MILHTKIQYLLLDELFDSITTIPPNRIFLILFSGANNELFHMLKYTIHFKYKCNKLFLY